MPYSTGPDLDDRAARTASAANKLLRRRADRYARPVETVEIGAAESLEFRRGEGRYAIALADLREIRPLERLCLVPGASPVVPGMFHHRGEVLSAHDVAAFVGVASSEAPSFVLIVEHGQRRIGLLADELLDAVRIDAATHRPVPVAMGERAGCFTAVSQGDVLVLDVGGLFSMKRFFCAF